MKRKYYLWLPTLLSLFLLGCENDAVQSRSQVPSDPSATRLAASTQGEQHKIVTLQGVIKPANREVPFVEVPAVVTLEEMNLDSEAKVIASTVVKASYEDGFLASYQLQYDPGLLKKNGRYYVRVAANQNNQLLWSNNILVSGVTHPRNDSVVNITVR
ncbi:hypothetical protein BOO24_15625 [Vibrio navarrensis]|uniref:YbaY family lipoprotein n=1 Tax=Vibrio navarrensis TaxID=29495 RepID=UPI001869BC17|nr:YbaY family lipoprotein [Vibrio navarrensis]MBE3668311.1 hypothetical protein [Vibrio navarrensis]MBE4593760.1 hypothetical protein [Vibrio navarrensis]